MFCFYLWSAAQIILESFPISSSGHLKLLSFYCPLTEHPFMGEPFITFVEYALHSVTALVVLLFFLPVWSFPFIHIKRCWKLIIKISCLTALSTSVTVAGYGAVSSAKSMLPQQSWIVLLCGFCITSLMLFSLLWCPRGNSKWNISKACMLGFIQLFAFIPGISRLASTYVVARWLGIPARRAFEISFLIQWPLIVCASVYSNFVLYTSGIQLLNLSLVWVMLGAGMMAYIGLMVVSLMVKKRVMWWWSVYVLLPITMSFIIGVLHA